MAICELRDVHKRYPLGDLLVPALSGVSVAIEPGEFTVFTGPSGSGKTTLLNLVGLLDTASSGTVTFEGRAVSGLSEQDLGKLRAQRIGFIFQSFNLIPVLSAFENVELALRLSETISHAERRQRVEQALTDVGLNRFMDRRPAQLSGGQQQRVAVARALVKQPALVIADEPTANLDSENGEAIVSLMEQLNADKGATFLFSSHDKLVVDHARRVVTLKDGLVATDEVRS